MPAAKSTKNAKISGRGGDHKAILTKRFCEECHSFMRQNEIMAEQVIDLSSGSGKARMYIHHSPKACNANKELARAASPAL